MNLPMFHVKHLFSQPSLQHLTGYPALRAPAGPARGSPVNSQANAAASARLAAIDQECAAAAAAGEDAREAALHQEAAVLLTALERTPEALRRVERARALHAAAGRAADEARAVYTLGFLAARRGGAAATARERLGEALAKFVALGEHALAGRTRGHLAALSLR